MGPLLFESRQILNPKLVFDIVDIVDPKDLVFDIVDIVDPKDLVFDIVDFRGYYCPLLLSNPKFVFYLNKIFYEHALI